MLEVGSVLAMNVSDESESAKLKNNVIRVSKLYYDNDIVFGLGVFPCL